MDLITLPKALLQDGSEFERKYTLSLDRFNEEQVLVQQKLFDKVFNKEFERFRNKEMSLIELMSMHRRIF